MLMAGHMDELGLLITYVDEQGFLYFRNVGGMDLTTIAGRRVSILTREGVVTGVTGRRAIHLLNAEERKKVPELHNLWIDIGATDKADAESVVRIADPVTVHLGMQELRNGLAAAPAMDNRTGVWVVFEAARRAHARGISCTLAVASTVQEEIGLRGTQTAAFGIDPHVGIAVDVTHATDCPTIDKRQRGTVELGKGPVIVRGPNINPRVGDRLTALSEEKSIPSQPAALGRAAPNDANPMQLTRAGVATGLVQIPNRYMHSAVETISLDDLDACADLLAAFAVALSEEDSFVP